MDAYGVSQDLKYLGRPAHPISRSGAVFVYVWSADNLMSQFGLESRSEGWLSPHIEEQISLSDKADRF
jgi:hypothetical protein